MRLALYQPDIAPNVGTLIRLGACLDVPVDVIEPCGFPFGDKAMRRAALDYGAYADVVRHLSWSHFLATQGQQPDRGRLILLSTKADVCYTAFQFQADDTLMVGRETAGVPDTVWDETDAQVTVGMIPGVRSLNVATAAAMVLGEALRQTGLLIASSPPGVSPMAPPVATSITT